MVMDKIEKQARAIARLQCIWQICMDIGFASHMSYDP